jgi:methyltransferase (TIGR00027 family)
LFEAISLVALALPALQVFEVDHPATSTAKQAKVRALIGEIPAIVTYIPVDFTVDNLADKLLGCGYRTTCPTVFLWEGVTPYLDPEAVDAVLGFVMTSAAGSAIVFDYILRSVVAGTCTLREAANEFAKMSRTDRCDVRESVAPQPRDIAINELAQASQPQ